MWLGLKDYSNGIFHEPRFYGQAYNSFMEAFFAIPLYKCGITANKSLPIVTSFFALTPYLLISILAFLKKSPKISFIIISIPLLLPVEYSLLTSIPRGFVTGIFISSLGCLSLFYPASKRMHFFCGLVAVVAYSINPNSIILTFAWLLFLFFENIRTLSFYFYFFVGSLFGALVHFLLTYFYVLNPFYNIHKFTLSFSFETLFNSLKNLDVYLDPVIPLWFGMRFLTLLIFPVLAFFLFKQHQRLKAVIICFIPFIIILMLGVSKVHDGSPSIFLPFSRMFLSVPVLFGLSLACLSKFTYSNWFNSFIFIPCLFFIYQVKYLDKTIAESIAINDNKAIISVSEVRYISQDCAYIKKICAKYNIQLIVISNHWNQNFYNYACPACDDNFPNTLKPDYERRTWRLLEDEKKVYKNILILDGKSDLSKKFPFIEKVAEEPDFYIIRGNQKFTFDLLHELKIEVRKYK